MLERQGLHVGPWIERRCGIPVSEDNGSAISAWMREIVDAHSREPLGAVHRPAAPTWPLFRWLSRRLWTVVETEDESLLLTLYSPWGFVRPWEVRDADERLICTIAAGDIFDSAGHLTVRMNSTGSADSIHFVSKDRKELGSTHCTAAGIEVAFAPSLQNDPFAKMALLGAALTLESGNRDHKK